MGCVATSHVPPETADTLLVPPADGTASCSRRLPPCARASAPGEDEAVAWCVQRADDGRGFGIVMPHFYKNWSNEDLRRFVLNGIVWTAGVEVPADGVNSKLPELKVFGPKSAEAK